MIVAEPPAAIALVEVVSVIEDPVGAVNGVFSQAAVISETIRTNPIARTGRKARDIMSLNILSAMDLAGQQRFARKVAIRRGDRGYAMAALLVSLSIMSVMLTVAMPAWKQMARREKEEELIFRGQQYARAIGLFQRRAGPGALPPNFDILVQQKFLRKKYKDPITNDDFQPLLAGQQGPGQQQPGAGRGGVSAPGTPVAVPGQTPATQAPGAGTTGAVGGIQGVVSKSKEKSLRLYNGRGTYNEWTFVFVPQQQAAGQGGAAGRGGASGQPIPGGPGGRGGSGRGGLGNPGGPGGGFGGPGGGGARGQGGFGSPGPFTPGGSGGFPTGSPNSPSGPGGRGR